MLIYYPHDFGTVFIRNLITFCALGVDGQRAPPPPWDFRGLLGGPGLAVGEDAHQLAEHHGEGVGARAGRVVEEAVPHALDGALLGLDELGRDGAQPLDEAADLATLRVGAGAGLRLGSQGYWLVSD